MSFICDTLRKSKYDRLIIMPKDLKDKHIINDNKKAFSVIGVLKPEDSITSFYESSFFKTHLNDYIPYIPMVRIEIYAFVMDLNGQVSVRLYHPTLPVSIYCCRDEKTRKYDINKSFDIWMLNFSSYFAVKKPEKFDEVLQLYPKGEIKDELNIISGLALLKSS